MCDATNYPPNLSQQLLFELSLALSITPADQDLDGLAPYLHPQTGHSPSLPGQGADGSALDNHGTPQPPIAAVSFRLLLPCSAGLKEVHQTTAAHPHTASAPLAARDRVTADSNMSSSSPTKLLYQVATSKMIQAAKSRRKFAARFVCKWCNQDFTSKTSAQSEFSLVWLLPTY